MKLPWSKPKPHLQPPQHGKYPQFSSYNLPHDTRFNLKKQNKNTFDVSYNDQNPIITFNIFKNNTSTLNNNTSPLYEYFKDKPANNLIILFDNIKLYIYTNDKTETDIFNKLEVKLTFYDGFTSNVKNSPTNSPLITYTLNMKDNMPVIKDIVSIMPDVDLGKLVKYIYFYDDDYSPV